MSKSWHDPRPCLNAARPIFNSSTSRASEAFLPLLTVWLPHAEEAVFASLELVVGRKRQCGEFGTLQGSGPLCARSDASLLVYELFSDSDSDMMRWHRGR